MTSRILLAGTLALAMAVSASESKAQPLLSQLGAETYAKRESAEKELLAMGAESVPALKIAIDRTPDPEVRARAKRVLDSIVTTARIETIFKEYGTDPLKLEVAARLMLKDRREDDARMIYRAAAQSCRDIAEGKVKHPMGPDLARRKADELEIRSLAEVPIRPSGNVRIIRNANGGQQIVIGNAAVRFDGEEIDEDFIQAIEFNGGVLIGE
jgi:hypothetical protein